MHWQRQGQRTLRARRQGFDRHHHARAPGGQFVLHAKVLPGKPYDGHTLCHRRHREAHRCAIERAYVYKGCRGHDTANPRRVFISRSTASSAASNAKPPRRSAIAVIGHTKTDGRLGRCYLKGHEGNAANVTL